jgi:hypothetical protein
LAKRQTLVHKNGAAVCAAFCRFDDARRYELGVEAICRLATDVGTLIVKNPEAMAPAESIERYWGIVHAVSAQPPLPLTRMSVTMGKLVWMCLTQATRWMNSLVRVHSKDRWGEVVEMILAWQNAWGNDARARYAQAKFSTLTGIVRAATDEKHVFMHTALIKALSDVQA